MQNTVLKLPESIAPADAAIPRSESAKKASTSKQSMQLRLSEAHDLLVEQSRIQHDELIEARDIRLLTSGGLRIGSQEYPLAGTPRRNLFTLLGLPAAYMLKLSLYLQQINLNHATLQNKERKLLLRFEAGRIRAVLSESYIPIDHHEIVQGLMDAGVHKNKNVGLRVDASLMQLNILDKERIFRVKADDTFVPGLSITNSETGQAGLCVSAYMLRQLDGTGIIQNIWGTATNFRHTSKQPLQRMGHALGRAYTKTHHQKKILKYARQEKVAEPGLFVRRMADEYKLSKEQRHVLELEVEQSRYQPCDDPGIDTHTLYHTAHVISKAAQHHSLNTLQSAMLQQISGAVVEMGLYD